MNRHDFLRSLHETYRPRNYLEIGIRDGYGVAQSKARTIGVDPAYGITAEIACDLQLVRATSDEFFDRPDPLGWFAEDALDLAFIDGMHLFEFALRDFINTEKLSHPSSAIVFDDMLPRSVLEAARDRKTRYWAGDVYKIIPVLERYRPDLIIVPLDTEPTGMLLVLGTDPSNTVLHDNYEGILREYVHDDPQHVSDEIMFRQTAAATDRVLAHPIWVELARTRVLATTPDGLDEVRELRGTADYHHTPPADTPYPAVKPPRPRPNAAAKKTAAKKAPAKKAAAKKPPPPPPAPTLIQGLRKALKDRL